ncbi:MAG: RecQ family ATP-dependent DNA helicase, partial [Gammaproteobacteria bacterium]|nr:RecQ family ATP-dependent DNA helicase [Gammaproteobacteria bacterium]
MTKAEKPARILDLVREALVGDSGGAIVFTATRRNAEVLCEHIAGEGWRCEFFHAGLEPGTKREIQQGFVSGILRVIVATNAFGMGIDKPDVRLVIHADIPGSLESYLQEGGRAGRDGGPARCVLLYDDADVETQFGLSARSRLTQADFAGILKALRLRSRKLKNDEIVVTAAELLLEEDAGIDIDPGSPDADTKVKTAIAHLERNRFLVREENRTRVFSTSLRVATLEEGLARLDRADLSKAVRERYRTVLDLVIHADAGEGLSTDELVIRAAIPPDECFRTLQNLERLGILSNDLGLRVVLRTGVKDTSEARLWRVCEIERALVEVMAEAAPDADSSNGQVGTEQVGSEQVLTLSGLCQGVRERLEGSRAAAEIIPDRLLAVLRTMAHAFGGAKARRAMLDIRKAGSGEWRVRVRRPWRQIREITEMRRAVAQVLLRALCAKLPPGLQSADAIVECKARDLTDALRSDLDVAARLRDPDRAIEQGLLYLHETEVLILDQGRTVFR